MITQIYCSRTKKSHPIGGIDTDAHGLLLTYLSAVITSPDDPNGVESPQDGYHYRRAGTEQELRWPTDEALEIDLWCPHCKKGHPVNVGALFDAAQRRQPNVRLTSRGAWEGLWK
jgi:hypothetical protein